MANNPVPVIMLSSLSRDHADITMEALNLGACDFVTKDFSNWSLADKERELIGKVKNVSRNGIKLRLLASAQGRTVPEPAPAPRRARTGREILSIGASTGGRPSSSIYSPTCRMIFPSLSLSPAYAPDVHAVFR